MRMVKPRILPERGHSGYRPRTHRRILCVFPEYAPSFGTFQHSYGLMPGVRAFMPPQGLLLIAAYLPRQWEVRFVDENVRRAHEGDYRWADVVLVSGMHVQHPSIQSINTAAHRCGTATVLGGPSVSACPEYYPQVDVLHIGELGDATDALIEMIDAGIRPSFGRSDSQVRLETTDRLPLQRFPIPAYRLVDLRRYFLGSVQFSSGCPYMCEFCDIPALYGRSPRLKTPNQVTAELDAIIAAGCRSAVYFVDDNFVANRNAAAELVPHLIRWQQTRGYPIRFACEATLNITQAHGLLGQMREARFDTVFCGIETPEPDALRAMKKKQNLREPILEAVKTLNEHGMEVVSGIILGLDTDTPDTPNRVLDFIDRSQIPMLTINLLYALPKTPLYDRLKAEGRLLYDTPSKVEGDRSAPFNGRGRVNGARMRESNVIFKMPYERVRAMWMRCVSEAYEPERLLQRFAYQCEHTYPNRARIRQRLRASQVGLGLRMLKRVLVQCGVRNSPNERRQFWRAALPLLRAGRIEEVIHIGLVSHHLVKFTHECQQGASEVCFYADPASTDTRPQNPENSAL